MSKIALFFLAHDGISLPATWNRWRAKAPDKIVFYAMSPKKYEGFKSLEPYSKTAWCHPSLVYAYLNGLKQILKDDEKKEIAVIYLVSGTDIPIRSAEFLLSLRPKTRICPAGTAELRLDTEKTQRVDLMHQWFAITRSDAEKLSSTTEAQFIPLMKFYQASIEKPSEEIFQTANKLWLTNLEKLQNQHKDEKKKAGYLNTLNFYHSLVTNRLKQNILETPRICPDEYWPLYLMKDLKISPENDCTTGIFKPVKDVVKFGPLPNPVTWNSPTNDVYALKSNDPGSRNVYFKDVIQDTLPRWPNAIFFRKVGPTFPQDYDTWQ